jgi:hypothetical protein
LKYSLKDNLPLSLPIVEKRGTHTTDIGGKSFHTNLKRAWKDNEYKLLTPITSNKNGQESNKNLEAMTGATRTQLLK